jgi:hypothetical protein
MMGRLSLTANFKELRKRLECLSFSMVTGDFYAFQIHQADNLFEINLQLLGFRMTNLCKYLVKPHNVALVGL